MDLFYDRGKLLAGLMKGATCGAVGETVTGAGSSACPFS